MRNSGRTVQSAPHPTLGLLADAFHVTIRLSLENAANQALTQQLDRLSERLETVLENIMPAGVMLDMSALQLRHLQINIEKQGIRLEGTASGSARLLLR